MPSSTSLNPWANSEPHPRRRDRCSLTGSKRSVALETTAAEALIEAPTSSIAREVEVNADHVQDAAHDAANAAKVICGALIVNKAYHLTLLPRQSKGPALTGAAPSAVDQFERQAKQTTDAAVAEGQHDVEAAKATGAGYVEQAKTLASNAISTAQVTFMIRI